MSKNHFRERTLKAWKAFVKGEKELRRLLDCKDQNNVREELIGKCSKILELAFDGIAFELGYNGKKYELILSPEGNKTRLFELVYFRSHAPASVLENWNICVGRQPNRSFVICSGEWEVSADDVMVSIQQQNDRQVSLILFCEKLLPLLREDSDKAWWILSVLVDQVIGEIPAMAHIAGFDIAEQPSAEFSVQFGELANKLKDMGLDMSLDPQEFLDNSYTGYEIEPNDDTNAELRMDVYIGTTRCIPLIYDHLNDESYYADILNGDGAEAGFIFYPLDGFTGDNRSSDILDFRDALENALTEKDGEETMAFLGGATGIYFGYLDLIAWDRETVIERAERFFKNSSLEWAAYRPFRRGSEVVKLLDR